MKSLNVKSLKIPALLLSIIMIGCSSCSKKMDKTKTDPVKNEKTEAQAVLKPQTTCPVMGGKINKSLYADVKGYRIYVCCPSCIDAIKKNPDKYIEKLHKMGVKIAKVPENTKSGK